MAERDQSIAQGREAIQTYVGSFALMGLQQTLSSDQMIYIGFLKAVITPEGALKHVSNLTAEELAANPHIDPQ